MLSVFSDLFRDDPAGESLATQISERLQAQRSGWYTTQELMWSLTGANGYAQQGYGAQALSVGMSPPLKALDRAPYAAAPAAGGSAWGS